MIKQWFKRLLHLSRKTVFSRRRQSELDAELQFHLNQTIEVKTAAGLSAEEARRQTLIEFGGIERTREQVHQQRPGWWLGTVAQDLRYALRGFRRSPGFTLTVVGTLALAIGANTAIFSLVNALILKALPYAHPERLGTIYTRVTGLDAMDERHNLDGEQWERLRDDVPALISAVSDGGKSGVNLRAGARVEYLRTGRISAHYLDVLAIEPLMGRNFSEVEDRPGGPNVVILSYDVWRNTFAASAGIVGTTVFLKSEPYTVVGVLPERAITPLQDDLYTPIAASRNGEGNGTNFSCITRLREGATWQEADAQINHAWAYRAQRFEAKSPGAHVAYYSVPLQKGESGRLRPQALALMMASALILLIACANLAGLTLVRMMSRAPELATRQALGASRARIQRQLWIENLLPALAGGLAGVGVGWAALRGLLTLLPEHFLPVAGVPLDGRVLGFTLAVSVLTSVLFGMLPALATGRFDLRSAMGNRAATGSDHLRLRQVLIGGEVALTVVLLAAAGLLVRTLIHLETLPPGFDPSGVLTARVSLNDARFHDPAAFHKLLDDSTAAMRRIPGVEFAAVGLALPYERTLNDGMTLSDGKDAGTQVVAGLTYVTPEYFSALRIPIVLGREFNPGDGPLANKVAIVNQTFARKFFHGENPLGRHLDRDMVIVGVAGDVAIAPGLDPTVGPLSDEEQVYIPASQVDVRGLALIHVWFQPSWIVRSAKPVEGLTAQMQRALAGADPSVPISGFFSMRDLLQKTLAIQRVEVALLGAMAGLALLLSTVGIFALVASIVTQRTREIGIRIALGSTVRQAMIHLGTPGVRASAMGLVLGLAICAGVLRIMRSVLYGVSVYDAPTIVSAVLTLVVVTLAATALPTLRIGRIDPAKTLRDE